MQCNARLSFFVSFFFLLPGCQVQNGREHNLKNRRRWCLVVVVVALLLLLLQSGLTSGSFASYRRIRSSLEPQSLSASVAPRGQYCVRTSLFREQTQQAKVENSTQHPADVRTYERHTYLPGTTDIHDADYPKSLTQRDKVCR